MMPQMFDQKNILVNLTGITWFRRKKLNHWAAKRPNFQFSMDESLIFVLVSLWVISRHTIACTNNGEETRDRRVVSGWGHAAELQQNSLDCDSMWKFSSFSFACALIGWACRMFCLSFYSFSTNFNFLFVSTSM